MPNTNTYYFPGREVNHQPYIKEPSINFQKNLLATRLTFSCPFLFKSPLSLKQTREKYSLLSEGCVTRLNFFALFIIL